MALRCDEPSCGCQKARPVQPPPSIKVVLQDPRSGYMEEICQKYSELDVKFDLFYGAIDLEQKTRDPDLSPRAQRKTWVELNQENSQFINLEGLKDNSLLLSFHINSPDSFHMAICQNDEGKQCHMGTKFKIRHEVYGYIEEGHDMKEPLFGYFMYCPCEERCLQLHLPKDRIKSWRTVGKILLTYRKINLTIWHQIRTKLDLEGVAGFNWTQVQEEMEKANFSVNFAINSNNQNGIAK